MALENRRRKPMQRSEAYLDIETTGLSQYLHEITVVGICLSDAGGDTIVQLVGGEVTRENLAAALAGVAAIYTYNGGRFDLPFIELALGIDLASEFRHRDLMYDCWQRNLYGGLKVVEARVGIPRRLKEVNGRVAVQLWWRYVEEGDLEALNTLLEYNREDVVNLKALKERLEAL